MPAPLPYPLADRTGWPWTEVVDPGIYDGLPRLWSVSVLVPSFNQGRFLEECLRSILAQSYPILEVLVADGGSTDESAAVLAHYAPSLAWHVSEADRGTWDADNKALAKATGEFVLVVNSDDYLTEGGLLYLLQAVLQPDSQGWATGCVNAVNELGETKAVFKPRPWPGSAPGRTFLKECWIYHPSTIVRRDLIGRFEETDLMDWELWIRLEKAGLQPMVTAHVVAGLRFHGDSKSFDSGRIYRSQLHLLDKLADRYEDRLKVERATAKRRAAEAEMVRLAGLGQKAKGLARWLTFGLTHPVLLMDRPYLGLGKRLVSGDLNDLYRPMAFLEQPPHTDEAK